jgi:hypothetical protein
MRTRQVRLAPVGADHKNCNGWVQNLDRGIRAELLRL